MARAPMAVLPTVSAVLLTANRPELTLRAIACFEKQTYPNKRLIIYDTTISRFTRFAGHYQKWTTPASRTVGELRNDANSLSEDDIIVHWDSDDWSHPERISEQVAFLRHSRAGAVGYRDVLFWRLPTIANVAETGQAWRYKNTDVRYAIGASLCYWRSTWMANRFARLPIGKGTKGEDSDFIKKVPTQGTSGLVGPALEAEPRLICLIHLDNTQYYGLDLLEASSNWSRVKRADSICMEVMEG